MWQILRVYGVGGNLLKAVQIFCVDSRACGCNVGLREDCLMSPWLFNVYVDGVVLDMNPKVVWERVGTAECKWLQV